MNETETSLINCTEEEKWEIATGFVETLMQTTAELVFEGSSIAPTGYCITNDVIYLVNSTGLNYETFIDKVISESKTVNAFVIVILMQIILYKEEKEIGEAVLITLTDNDGFRKQALLAKRRKVNGTSYLEEPVWVPVERIEGLSSYMH